MVIEEIRLELLKLTYAHAREAAEAVVRARTLEKYVLQAAPAKKSAKKAEKPQG